MIGLVVAALAGALGGLAFAVGVYVYENRHGKQQGVPRQ